MSRTSQHSFMPSALLTKHGRQLRFGKGLCNAPVRAKAEAECICAPGPVHVEPVRVGKYIFVAVGRLVGSNDTLASLDRDPADLDVHFSHTLHRLGRAGMEA